MIATPDSVDAIFQRELKQKSENGKSENLERIELSIVSYNVWMMPEMLRTFGGLEVSPAKQFRARQIAEELTFTAKQGRESGVPWGLDVAVFQEAFCDLGRPVLL